MDTVTSTNVHPLHCLDTLISWSSFSRNLFGLFSPEKKNCQEGVSGKSHRPCWSPAVTDAHCPPPPLPFKLPLPDTECVSTKPCVDILTPSAMTSTASV